MYLLSMDFGTTSIKMGILTRDLELIKTAKAEYRYRVYNHNGRAGYRRCNCSYGRRTEKFIRLPEKVEIVVFDTFSPSVVIMDRGGSALPDYNPPGPEKQKADEVYFKRNRGYRISKYYRYQTIYRRSFGYFHVMA